MDKANLRQTNAPARNANMPGSPISPEDRPMRRMRLPKVSALALLMLLFWLPMAGAQDTATEVGTDIGTLYRDEAVPLYKAPAYSPYADRDYPRRVL